MALIAVDFESGSSNDRDGLCWWRPSFLIKSASFAWRNEQGTLRSCFVDDPTELRDRVEDLKNHSVLVYNASFDISIIRKHFPEAWPLEYVDVMRLRQLRERVEKLTGYGLKNAVRAHLRHLGGYEDEIKAWIRANVPECKKGKEGAHYDKAPREMLAAYNVKDSEATLLLFEAFTKYFAREGFDWTQDHELYYEQVNALYDATLTGIHIDQQHLHNFVAQVDQEVSEMDRGFNEAFGEEITAVRERLRLKKQATYKKKIVTELPPFNTGSKRHLEMLFVDGMGYEVVLTTPKGRPSFKSAHLPLYGKGGKMLAKRGKRLVVQAQAKGLLKQVSEEADARYHPQLKVVATTSGRLAGSGGVNIQGVSRKEVGIMGAMVADEGEVFVEIDLVSGEPTLITHYSQDEFYRYTNITGRGKAPFVKDGLCYIDDPYIAFGWVCGLYSEELKEAWNKGINGEPFVEAWLRDSEAVKTYLKKWRALWKMLVLALGYSMMPKKLQTQVRVQFGITLTHEQAQDVYNAYWKMFSGVKKLSDQKGKEFKRTGGSILTPFGFLAWPKAAHAAMNQYIQAQVSSIMIEILKGIVKRSNFHRYVTTIHDAHILAIPENRVDEFKQVVRNTMDEINDLLQWTVKIDTGFAYGKRWSDLK